jgi:hypothetical protein
MKLATRRGDAGRVAATGGVYDRQLEILRTASWPLTKDVWRREDARLLRDPDGRILEIEETDADGNVWMTHGADVAAG